MNSIEKLNHLWAKVSPLLLPYEGSASQVYVLDLPLNFLENTIHLFCQRANNPIISTLGGYSFSEEEAPICDVVSRLKILEAVRQNSNSIISGMLFNNRSISCWVWPDYEHQKFDAELVFWADEFFPEGMTEDNKITSFGAVYSLAEKLRENSPESECVLSSWEAGNPREERGQPHNVFW